MKRIVACDNHAIIFNLSFIALSVKTLHCLSLVSRWIAKATGQHASFHRFPFLMSSLVTRIFIAQSFSVRHRTDTIAVTARAFEVSRHVYDSHWHCSASSAKWAGFSYSRIEFTMDIISWVVHSIACLKSLISSDTERTLFFSGSGRPTLTRNCCFEVGCGRRAQPRASSKSYGNRSKSSKL